MSNIQYYNTKIAEKKPKKKELKQICAQKFYEKIQIRMGGIY